jgi:cation-transporting ATPase 13A1
MIKWTGKRIVKLSLYREVTNLNIGSIGYEHFIFIISYVIALYACWQSIGDQHYEALARAEERQINIYDESEKLRKSALDYISGSAGDIESASEPQFQIPSKWLPGFWQSIAFGIIIILHALMVLTQKWSVKFRCAVRFRECSTVVDATHVHVTPNKHQGKEELVPIIRSGPMNSICSFEFHRRKYIYDGRSNSFVKVRCRVDYAISHYREWNGISTELLQSQLTELHGLNAFQISSPQFMDLYIAQITSPFTVFQLFCVMLWCLDEYWRYSLFTLFMICSFEATTVFTRLKSLNTLRGMGNESRKIQLFRMGQWREGSTTDLLPGDIFSLTKAGDDVIPCDAMIVSGSVVVNEATLTGERYDTVWLFIFTTSYVCY